MQYPLSPQQTAVYSRYCSLVQARQRSIYGTLNAAPIRIRMDDRQNESQDYTKYQLLLGSPGTGKMQVVIWLIHTLIQE